MVRLVLSPGASRCGVERLREQTTSSLREAAGTPRRLRRSRLHVWSLGARAANGEWVREPLERLCGTRPPPADRPGGGGTPGNELAGISLRRMSAPETRAFKNCPWL